MSAELARTRTLIEQGIAEGWHAGGQLHVWHEGRSIDLAVGESRPDIPMTPDTINLWMSSVKPITAVAIAQQWERGLLDLDDRVTKYISEFGMRGKEAITIRHILTHTGGFRAVMGASYNDNYEDMLAKVLEAPLEPRWVPGQSAGYHANGAWYVLAEIVQRLSGSKFDRYVREAIFQPLGMNDSWIGMPADVHRAYGRRIGCLYDTSKGQSQPAPGSNGPEEAANVRPSSNGRGPMRELARFYLMLLHKGRLPDHPRLLQPQTVEAMVARHRVGLMDQTFKHVIDFGLGFIINSNQYGVDTVPYGYGPHASPRTFGHSGNQSSSAFCDPQHNLVVAWHLNGMPGEARHAARQRAVNQAIYEDLKLA